MKTLNNTLAPRQEYHVELNNMLQELFLNRAIFKSIRCKHVDIRYFFILFEEKPSACQSFLHLSLVDYHKIFFFLAEIVSLFYLLQRIKGVFRHGPSWRNQSK